MAEDADRALFSRRRRANVEGGRKHKHEVKVTPSEEAALKGLAFEQGVTIPRLLVESALAQSTTTITERRQLGFELSEVRRLLASISNNTNQLAKFANTEGVVADWAADVALDYKSLRPLINDAIRQLAGE